jgi:hypothetical protein
VDERPEAPATRPLWINALNRLNLNSLAGPQMRRRIRASERGDGLDRDRGQGGPTEQSFTPLFPRGISFLACCRGNALRIDFQDALMSKGAVLFYF